MGNVVLGFSEDLAYTAGVGTIESHATITVRLSPTIPYSIKYIFCFAKTEKLLDIISLNQLSQYIFNSQKMIENGALFIS